MSSKEAKPLKMTTKKVGNSGKAVYDYPDKGTEAPGTPRLRDKVRLKVPKYLFKKKKTQIKRVNKSQQDINERTKLMSDERKDYWVWKLSKSITPDQNKTEKKAGPDHIDVIDQGTPTTGPMKPNRGNSMGSQDVEDPKQIEFYTDKISDEKKKELKDKKKEMTHKSLGLSYVQTKEGLLPGEIYQFEGTDQKFAIVKGAQGCYTVNLSQPVTSQTQNTSISKSLEHHTVHHNEIPTPSPIQGGDGNQGFVQGLPNSYVDAQPVNVPALNVAPPRNDLEYEQRLGALLSQMGAQHNQQPTNQYNDTYQAYDMALMREHQLAQQRAQMPHIDLGPLNKV